MSHCARHSPKYLIIPPLQDVVGVNMYKRILLAYDGSVEGRTALREGALLAKQCGAEVFLLSVLTDTGTLLLSEVTLVGATAQMEEGFQGNTIACERSSRTGTQDCGDRGRARRRQGHSPDRATWALAGGTVLRVWWPKPRKRPHLVPYTIV